VVHQLPPFNRSSQRLIVVLHSRLVLSAQVIVDSNSCRLMFCGSN
jgi:hypothetical protein